MTSFSHVRRRAALLLVAGLTGLAPLSATANTTTTIRNPGTLPQADASALRRGIVPLTNGATLPVPLLPQMTNQWCWAASSLMVIKYYRPSATLSQCREATDASQSVVHKSLACCANPMPGDCIFAGYETLDTYGFTFTTSSTALPYAQLTAEIDAKRPVEYAVRWAPDYKYGHMMVAVGYFESFGTQFVRVNNPWLPDVGAHENQTYDYWQGGAASVNDHVMQANYYGIRDTEKPVLSVVIPHLVSTVPRFLGTVPVQSLKPVTIEPVVELSAAGTLAKFKTAPADIVRQFGFTSTDAASSATLGTGLQEFNVDTTALGSYDASKAAASIIAPSTSYVYPVVSNGRITSTLRLSAGADSRLQSIGDEVAGQHFETAASFDPRLRRRSTEAISSFAIRGLGLYFLGRGIGANLSIASIYDVPQYHLTRGVYEPVATVFARLAPFARGVAPGATM